MITPPPSPDNPAIIPVSNPVIENLAMEGLVSSDTTALLLYKNLMSINTNKKIKKILKDDLSYHDPLAIKWDSKMLLGTAVIQVNSISRGKKALSLYCLYELIAPAKNVAAKELAKIYFDSSGSSYPR
jgi:hypothetical protein